ncbi:MAG: DUF917 domain-containing protein [Nitrososphaerota archaeon]|nr:DUF917 domain-containing protein [Aigarchaeota archaeon]MDW8076804.1 DUF917 domain-containing protein [Nitrososphaerota archaeon]
MRILREKELKDIVYGATLLGAGGGGSPENGMQLVKSILEISEEVKMVSPEEVPDYSMIAVVAGMGAPEVLLKRGWRNEDIPALRLLEQVIGRKMDYIIAIETGGFNSITPLHAAVASGVPAIDGDGVGRAIPQLEMTMFYVQNVPLAPVTLADAHGNSAILYPVDAPMAEKMARGITVAFGMQAGIACHPMAGWQMKKAVIGGTYTLAEKVGRAMREAREKGKDPVKAVVEVTNGFEIARGKVAKKEVETRGGFDYGKVYVADIRVDYKNENMIAWRAGKPVAISPDLICWMTTDGRPLTNADIKEGLEVAVIGIKAHERWRTPEGLAVFRPVLAELGYTGDYIPIEKLL